jgi:hypothetical protein
MNPKLLTVIGREDPLAGLDAPLAAGPKVTAEALWDAWMFAEVEAELALAVWSGAPEGDQERAHSVYVAALDREEQAALALALKVEPRAGRRLRGGDPVVSD